MDWNLLLQILAGSHDIYALGMVTKVSKAFWGYSPLGYVLVQDFTSISSSQALQQGSMGLILTTLILTAPPMAAIFVEDTLGAFTPYAAMGRRLEPLVLRAIRVPRAASRFLWIYSTRTF